MNNLLSAWPLRTRNSGKPEKGEFSFFQNGNFHEEEGEEGLARSEKGMQDELEGWAEHKRPPK